MKKYLQRSHLYRIFLGLLLCSIGIPLSVADIQQSSFIQTVQASPIEPGEKPVKPKNKKLQKKTKAKTWLKNLFRTKKNPTQTRGVVFLVLGLLMGVILTIVALSMNPPNNSSGSISTGCVQGLVYSMVMTILILLSTAGYIMAILGILLLIAPSRFKSKKQPTKEEKTPPKILESNTAYAKHIEKLLNTVDQLDKVMELISQEGETEKLIQQKQNLHDKLKEQAAETNWFIPKLEKDFIKAKEKVDHRPTNRSDERQTELELSLEEKKQSLELAQKIVLRKKKPEELIILLKGLKQK